MEKIIYTTYQTNSFDIIKSTFKTYELAMRKSYFQIHKSIAGTDFQSAKKSYKLSEVENICCWADDDKISGIAKG